MAFDWDAIRNTAEKKAAAETEKETSSERTYFRWSKEQTDKLVALVDKQKTAEEIAETLGVPLDKVRNKLAMLKAKTPSVTQKPKAPLAVHTEQSALSRAQKPVAAPAEQTDWVVFYALDELVLRLQADGEDPSRTFRRALEILDLWAEGLREQIEKLPAARAHFAAIGALAAYQELTGRVLAADGNTLEGKDGKDVESAED